MKKNVLINMVIVTMTLFGLFFTYFSCTPNTEENKSTSESLYPAYYYNREIFVSVNYIFNNEGLYQPVMIRQNPLTKELFVLDKGNTCIYVFSLEGQFVRKIGRPGQGPGDLLKPEYIAFDNEGNLYVYEAGNYRFSIFSKEGKFIYSFRNINSVSNVVFTITNKKEIAAFIRKRDHYLTIFSRNGDIVKDIGEIKHYNDNIPALNETYAELSSILEVNGKYVIFLRHLPMVKIIDKSGKLLQEKLLNKELEITSFHDPNTLKISVHRRIILDAIYRFNNYYVFIHEFYPNNPDAEKVNFQIYVLNEEFNTIRKIYLPIEEPLSRIKSYPRSTFSYQFEVITENDDILLILMPNTEIYRYYR
ncbi:hypothetical protein AMJ80_02675 [bacterium SM23_31]|nr:MAG: hypothetical protein AMJ80_02675 [bacterium SM23_31]